MNRSGYAVLAAFLALFLMMGSCMTVDLKNVDIANIEMLLDAPLFGHAEAVIPGLSYTVGLKVVTVEGRTIGNVDLRKVRITSPNDSFDIDEMGVLGTRATANEDVLGVLSRGGYRLSVAFQDNAFVKDDLMFPVNWGSMNVIRLDGSDGS